MNREENTVPMAEWFVTAQCIATYHLGIKVEASTPEAAQTKAQLFFGTFNLLTKVGLTGIYTEGAPTIALSNLHVEPAP